MGSSLKLAVFFGLVCCVLCKNDKLKEVFSWKIVDFEYPTEGDRQSAINNKEFIPENNLPLGVERWHNKLFVTLPRWKDGTAATLTYIDLANTTSKSPKLKPYPDWQTHQDKKIISVFRLNVDVCDRLWLVDQGLNDILGKREEQRKPTVQVYDLHTDTQVKEYFIPDGVLKPDAFLANIIVETSKENCNEAIAYMADLAANSILVYSLKNDESWLVTHHFFSFDPLCGNYNIGGVNFQWRDGVFGLALSPVQKDGYRTLYFHPMSSNHEFSVSTKVLRDRDTYTLPERTMEAKIYHNFTVLGSRGVDTQSTSSSIDEKTGVMFYTLLNKNAVGCYNIKDKEYSTKTNAIVASDDVTMIFPNDLKVDKNRTLWVLTDKIPNFLFTELDWNDVNFRIFSASVDEAIKGTICDKSSSSRLLAMNSLVFVFLLMLFLR